MSGWLYGLAGVKCHKMSRIFLGPYLYLGLPWFMRNFDTDSIVSWFSGWKNIYGESF